MKSVLAEKKAEIIKTTGENSTQQSQQKDPTQGQQPVNEYEAGGGGMGDPIPSDETPDQQDEEPMITSGQLKAIQTYFSKKGTKDRDDRLAELSNFFQKMIESTKDLTCSEAKSFLDAINSEEEAA